MKPGSLFGVPLLLSAFVSTLGVVAAEAASNTLQYIRLLDNETVGAAGHHVDAARVSVNELLQGLDRSGSGVFNATAKDDPEIPEHDKTGPAGPTPCGVQDKIDNYSGKKQKLIKNLKEMDIDAFMGIRNSAKYISEDQNIGEDQLEILKQENPYIDLTDFWGVNENHCINLNTPHAMKDACIRHSFSYVNLARQGKLNKGTRKDVNEQFKKDAKKACKKLGHDAKKQCKKDVKAQLKSFDKIKYPYCPFREEFYNTKENTNASPIIPTALCSCFYDQETGNWTVSQLDSGN